MDVYQRMTDTVHAAVDTVIVLNHDQRSKGRLKTEDTTGEPVRLFLERGKSLMPGELLKSECGRVIEVQAAVEPVMIASCDDWLLFSRACYHLGNRHVKIEVNERSLKITPDHVLQEMLELLGLTVQTTEDVFVPESGAYFTSSAHGHHHSEAHEHKHGHHH